MSILYLEYPKCSTCQKAKKWLETNNIIFEQRDIVKQNPTKEELKLWHEKSGMPLKKFFNTSGLVYKELNLKDKLKDMTEEEQYAILATNGMLVKRPIIVGENIILTGFKETEWEKLK
ncbi:arsenate reductase family protein [Lachnospiraceae bacterium 46-61]